MLRRAFIVMLVAAGILAAATEPAAAAPTTAVSACHGIGWQTVGTSDEQLFRNRGDCIRYGVRGGTYVPLLRAVIDESCILEPNDPPNAACLTVAGFGLAPGSAVRVAFLVDGAETVVTQTVDASGRVFFQTAVGCVPGPEEVGAALAASGVTATGLQVSTPVAEASLFCTRL